MLPLAVCAATAFYAPQISKAMVPRIDVVNSPVDIGHVPAGKSKIARRFIVRNMPLSSVLTSHLKLFNAQAWIENN
jgi:hypothetical protein